MNRSYLFFMAMGFELVGLVLVFLYLGQYIDTQYKTRGMGVAFCLVAGLVIWFVHIIFQLKRLNHDEDE